MKFATRLVLGMFTLVALTAALSSGACTTSADGLGAQVDDLGASDDDDDSGGHMSEGGQNGGGREAGKGGTTAQGGRGGNQAGGGGGTNTGGRANQGGSAGNANVGGRDVAGGTGGNMNMGGVNTGGGNAGTGGMNTGGMNMGGPFQKPETPKSVVCGDVSCISNQVCCLSQSTPICTGRGPCPDPQSRECDDTSDCGRNEACCGNPYGTGFRSTCVAEAVCANSDVGVRLCANSLQCGDELCCEAQLREMTVGVCQLSCG